MNTVIYARYSAGPRQTDQSIEGQLRVCTDFCKQRGLTVIDTYCDRHISGRTDERPEFQRLIADAKRKKFEAVVVYKTDRLPGTNTTAPFISGSSRGTESKSFMQPRRYRTGPRELSLRALWKASRNTTRQSSLRKSSGECTRAL